MSETTVLEGGRRKVYRPLPATARREAARAGLAAYRRGDWFLAHELLEPAWMGSDDPAERSLHSGIIKLAAAGVHATRGNRVGVIRNLAGARERLGPLAAAGPAARPAEAIVEPLDLARLVNDIDRRLVALEAGRPIADPPELHPVGAGR